MPPRSICDTDTLSEVIKFIDPRVIARASAYRQVHGVLTFTSATVMEILHGLHRKGAHAQRVRTERVFSQHDEIVPQRDDYRLAAEILGALDRRGTPIGHTDPLIAACTLNRSLTLATGNTRHFSFIVDAGFPLRLEDCRQP